MIGLQNRVVKLLLELFGAGKAVVFVLSFDQTAGHGYKGTILSLLDLDTPDRKAVVEGDRGVCQFSSVFTGA